MIANLDYLGTYILFLLLSQAKFDKINYITALKVADNSRKSVVN